VFLSDRSGSPQLYLMERSGGNVRRLTFTGGYNASPAWSPRGDLIAFSTRMGAEFQIAVITPDGRDGRLITKDAHSYEDPRWAPDGRHLVCTERGREETVSVVDIVTGGKRILAQGSDPDWSRP
jgi:TolB protein